MKSFLRACATNFVFNLKTIGMLVMLWSLTWGTYAQNFTEPWKPHQLLPTKELAERINNNNMENTVLINIGPAATIKNSYDIGAGGEIKNVEKLSNYLKTVQKDKEIVIYCGCCPFDVCPNIRPAFKAVINSGFKHVKLLNIKDNIKVDWIDKGYPIN